MARYSIIIVLVLLLMGCGGKRYTHIPKDIEQVDVCIVRLDEDLLSLRADSAEVDMQRLMDAHSAFMPYYVENILGLDASDIGEVSELYVQFLQDTVMGFAQTHQEVKKQYSDIGGIEKELTYGFSALHWLFPEWEIPTIYLFVSGFNASIVSCDDVIGVGVDMYLGSDYPYYNQVVYNYQKTTMSKAYLAGDMLNYYIAQHLPYMSKNNRLLEHMLYRGKQLYLLAQLLPVSPEWEVIGYTREQWEWCVDYETAIWNRIMDKRDLFKTDSRMMGSYLNDGPFTAEVSNESPGRLGIWVGWRIVDSYMRQNPEVTLQELMYDGAAQKILERRYYSP